MGAKNLQHLSSSKLAYNRVVAVRRLITIVVAFGFIRIGTCVEVCPSQTAAPTIQSLRNAVLAAKDGQEAGEAYHRLFTHVTKAQLQRLKNDAEIGIALQAAWELAKKP